MSCLHFGMQLSEIDTPMYLPSDQATTPTRTTRSPMRKKLPNPLHARPPYLAVAVLVCLGAAGAYAQNVLQPTDPIIASSANSPGSEGVKNAIDGTTAKYLNRDSANDAATSGFVVTPQVGDTWVTGIAIQTANDAPDRDPKEMTLEGSNDDVADYSTGTWELIADIPNIPYNATRFAVETFAFKDYSPYKDSATHKSYKHYRWTVVHTQGNNGIGSSTCCMQIAEVQLLGQTVPKNVVVPTDAVVASSANSPGSEGVKNAIDGTTAKYLNRDSANDAATSGFVVTPSVGATVLQGVAIQTANDAPDRDPKEMTLEGSNDDAADYTTGTWTLIIDIKAIPYNATRFAWETFLFDNVVPYKHYRWTVVHTQGNNGVGASTCCMQIAEVQFLGTGAPQNILVPTDAIIASSANSPGSEGVKNAIDGTTAKYLNRDSANDAATSGFVVTPSVGPTTITGIAIQTANDSPDRDPKEMTIEGSNDDTADYSTGTWTLITDIKAIPYNATRFAWEYFYFPNSTAYKHYRWTVVHTQGTGGTGSSTCCMQIAEVQLLAVTSKADCNKAAFVSTPVETPVLSGAQTQFFVEVNGPWPLQWLTNGVPVPGASQTSLTTDPITAANAGIVYQVAIVGCQTSPPVHAVIFTPSEPRSIGIQFTGGQANGAGAQGYPRSAMTPDLIAGVQLQAYYNVVTNNTANTGITGDGTTQGDFLFDSFGNPATNADGTSITFEYNTSGHWGAGVGNDTPTQRLLNGIAGANGPGTDQTLTFHGVPAGSHAVLLYSISPPLQFQRVSFTVGTGGPVIYQRNLESGEYKLAPGFYRSTSTSAATPSIGDFVRFDGVQPDASGDITVTFAVLDSADQRTGVNALQLVLNAPNPGAPPVITQQPPQTVGLSGGVVALTVGATGDGLTYQWRKNGQNLFNGGHVSGANSATLTLSSLSPDDEANYSVAVFNKAGSTVSKNASVTISIFSITDGLAAYWKFDETSGTTASNSASNGVAAAISGSATWSAGQVGNSLGFDGSTTFGYAGNYSKASRAIAGSAWINVPSGTSASADAVVFRNQEGNFQFGSVGGITLGQFELQLAYESISGSWSPSATIGLGNNYARLVGQNAFPIGGWHHLAFSADGAQLTLYVDGVVAGVIDYVGNINPPSIPGIYIGARGITDTNQVPAVITLDPTNPDQFTGKIDELALWKRALTPSEVTALYEAGKAGKALTTIVETPPAGAPTVAVSYSGGNVTVTWDRGVLQTAPAVTGPWTDQTSASSPLTEPVAPGTKFYRVHN